MNYNCHVALWPRGQGHFICMGHGVMRMYICYSEFV